MTATDSQAQTKPNTEAESDHRIFVSLASFCDRHLPFTVDSLYSTAKDPSRVFAAIIDQHPVSRREQFSAHPRGGQIRYLHIEPVDSRGVSWARSLAFGLYRNESHVLQVDSHTWFQPDWDQRLIDLLDSLEKKHPKAVITCYPPGFSFNDDDQPVADVKPTTDVMAFAPLHDATFTGTRLICGFNTRWVPQQAYTTGFHIAGGFIFTRGQFIEEIPYDPYMYFSGEEQNLAVRAWTHGWDLIHPRMCDVPVSHLYKTSGKAHDEHHWRTDLEERRAEKWPVLQQRAQERFCRLVGERTLTGAYGLGSTRTLEAFAEFSGLDYPNRRIRRMPCLPHEADKKMDMSGFGRVRIDTDAGPLTAFANDAHSVLALEAHKTLYKSELQLLFKDTPATATVVQMGCFIGYQSVCIARHLNREGRLLVFEAQAQLRALLYENLTPYFNSTRVFISDKAAWDRCVDGYMPRLSEQKRADHSSARFQPGPIAENDSGSAFAVSAVSLDSLKLDHIDILQIDLGPDTVPALKGSLETIRRCKPRLLLSYSEAERAGINAVLGGLTGYALKKVEYPVHAKKTDAGVAGLIPADSVRSVLLMLPQ